MGAVTPIYAFPYPVGTDRVMDGDNAIQALAEKVEALFNPAAASSAWTTAGIVASSGWAAPGSPGHLGYRLIGPFCEVRLSYNRTGGDITPSAGSSNLSPDAQVCTLPVPARPVAPGVRGYFDRDAASGGGYIINAAGLVSLSAMYPGTSLPTSATVFVSGLYTVG